jgi:hypothetical protein
VTTYPHCACCLDACLERIEQREHTDPCPSGCNAAVPVPRLRATVALLSPDEITPTAQRLLLRLCDEHQPATADST